MGLTHDGTAGDAIIHSRRHTYFDGIEIDDEGYIYASEPGINQIIVIIFRRIRGLWQAQPWRVFLPDQAFPGQCYLWSLH